MKKQMNMFKRVFTGIFLAALFAASAQAQFAPDAPTNLSLTPTTGSEAVSLDFSWTRDPSPPDGFGYHHVHLRVFGTEWKVKEDNSAPAGVNIVGNISHGGTKMHRTATSATFTNLMPGTTYQARVRSYGSEADRGPWSAVAQAETAALIIPSKPALSARRLSATSIALEWTEPSSNAETLTHFHVRWRTAALDPDGTPGNSDDVAAGTWQNASGDDADCADSASNPENCGVELAATARAYTITGLTDGTLYDIEVRGENDEGVGLWSETLQFTSEAPSTDATLTVLSGHYIPEDGSFQNLAITPAFAAATTSYHGGTLQRVKRVTITAAAAARASYAVKKDGVVVSRDFRFTDVPLRGGDNDILFEVTADDRTTIQTYTLTVAVTGFRTDTSLASLQVSPGELQPAFSAGVSSYYVALAGSETQTEITASATDAAASMQIGAVGGTLSALAANSASAQTLSVGDNDLRIVVTAEDKVATQTHLLTVFRAPPLSQLLIHDASLAAASRSAANSLLAATTFDPLTRAYAFTATRAVSGVVVTPTYSSGTLQYQRTQPSAAPASFTSIASGAASAEIALAGGVNVVVIRADGADYQVTITRAPDAPENLAAAPRDGRLRVTWDATDGATGYRVRWRTKTGPGAWQSESGNDDDGEAVAAPRYTIPGLTNATNYEVQARADNIAGDGEWSASVEAAPAEGLAIVSQPPDLVFLAGEALAQPVQLPGAQRGQTPYTFSLTGLPAGLEFNAAADTREITGTPTTETAAPVEVTYRVTDAASNSDERVFTVSIVTFSLDVDESGAEDGRDGILIARYLLGVRGAALPDKQSAAGADAVEAEIKAGADTKLLDVNADGNADGDDGILVARYMFGLRGAELVAGFSDLDADAVAAKIAELTQ
ncbi:MAG: fibronectin type III domain-containing protein [Gammaproteobacteria bacterium]|nr:fibronectin type III domain-containing protein [Gammaproteobacteria bacterium]